jgi:uncharacterized protein YbjT (DUF2867 family)
MDGKLVLVAGATGRLGGIVEVLLERGHAVRALTRELGSHRAAALRDAGADTVAGDYEDVDSLVRGAAGVDALFATGTAHRAGPEGERRHGANVARAASAARVPHVVYVSGQGASQDSPLPLYRAKAAVEADIRAIGVPATILAPVYFAENLFNPWNLPALRAGVFPSPVPVELPLQQVAVGDVVRFAALALERPETFAGRRLALASDEVTAAQAAAAVARVTGRPLDPRQVPVEQLAPPLAALFGWLARHPGGADVEALRRDHPEVGWQRYAEWAAAQLGRFRELCPEPHAAPA